MDNIKTIKRVCSPEKLLSIGQDFVKNQLGSDVKLGIHLDGTNNDALLTITDEAPPGERKELLGRINCSYYDENAEDISWRELTYCLFATMEGQSMLYSFTSTYETEEKICLTYSIPL